MPITAKDKQIIVQLTPKDIQLVTLLAKDHTIPQASEKLKANLRTMEKRIFDLKKIVGCSNLHGLVGYFFINKIIQ